MPCLRVVLGAVKVMAFCIGRQEDLVTCQCLCFVHGEGKRAFGCAFGRERRNGCQLERLYRERIALGAGKELQNTLRPGASLWGGEQDGEGDSECQ